MNSLFETDAFSEIKNRLNNLAENSERQWGKMNVGQMVYHCQLPLKIALKTEPIKTSFNPIMRLFKKSLYNDRPWRNGLPTASGFKITDEKKLNIEKEALESMIDAFHEKKSQTDWNPHPLFGNFTAEQWGKMQYKHLDHHLRQFGV